MTTSHDTPGGIPFALYLIRQMVLVKGFGAPILPEAIPFKDASDFVLTRHTALGLHITCVVDRVSHPERRFTLSADLVHEIGRQCQQYTGKFISMPVFLEFIEVQHGAIEQPDRERLLALTKTPSFSRVFVTSWILDIAKKKIWTSEPFNGALAGGPFIRRLMHQHFAFSLASLMQPVAPKRRPLPLVTFILLDLLIIVYATESMIGLDSSSRLRTLIALGGLNWTLVAEKGEWYRILASTFLHGSLFHLFMNSLALLVAGIRLERIVGHAWFAAIYVISAFSGSWLALVVSPVTTIGVGASGAIMGILAAGIVGSLRFPSGDLDTKMSLLGISVIFLIPALVPIEGRGGNISYAAHLGGAIGGAFTALAVSAFWPLTIARPKYRGAAAAIAVVALLAAAWSTGPIAKNYREIAVYGFLIPQNQVPTTDAAAKSQSAYLLERYPRDPRAHFFRALALIDARDMITAERELRNALADKDILTVLPPTFEERLRIVLALLLVDKKQFGEAREIAQPVCGALTQNQLRELFAKHRLCN